VGGTPVPEGKYPFMAVLVIQNSDGSTGLCGGTLIDSNGVLTAAHCLVNAQSVDLAVGRTVISQEDQGQVRFATDAFIHPRYNGALNNRYDTAVLTLDSAVTGMEPIKLATADQNDLETPGRELTVAGWGRTSEGGNTSDRMREVSVPVVSDAKAKNAYASTGEPSLRTSRASWSLLGKEVKTPARGTVAGRCSIRAQLARRSGS
jgi:secreted trypsin-like serine protease